MNFFIRVKIRNFGCIAVMISLILVFVGGVCAESSKVQQYLNSLSSKKIEARILVAKEIAKLGMTDPALFDVIEKQLLQNYIREDLSFNEIDLFSWYCKDLSSSGLTKYQETLKKIADKSSYIKIKYYAKQSLDLLPTYAKHNKDLALAQQSKSPTFDQQNSKLLAMLCSNNLKLKSDAAKTISRSVNIEQKVYDEIEAQLLNNYQLDSGDKELIDLMAWYCKALASSGQASYKPAVETVLRNTKSYKLRKYAKQSLNSFSSNAEKHKMIVQYISAGHDEKNASTIYELKSENLADKIKACRILVASDQIDPEIFEMVERIRLDCASGASHNLNRLLYKPGSGTHV